LRQDEIEQLKNKVRLLKKFVKQLRHDKGSESETEEEEEEFQSDISELRTEDVILQDALQANLQMLLD